MKITWLRRWQRSENVSVQDTEQQMKSAPRLVFRLVYENNLIGTLEFSESRWRFVYSDWFKNQSEIQPFANFPDVNQEYVSDDLPPFFESRIPGTSQPQVEAFLKEKVQASEGETKAALLKQFGRRTITNPFELTPAF
ncbi:MAG: HipA N-terminal domain-containing protein [Chitinophagales bacterium]|nr:HipA N-terminal domain-containing protein [Chitinophagales bacterium]